LDGILVFFKVLLEKLLDFNIGPFDANLRTAITEIIFIDAKKHIFAGVLRAIRLGGLLFIANLVPGPLLTKIELII
jgi:hypothetical protein